MSVATEIGISDQKNIFHEYLQRTWFHVNTRQSQFLWERYFFFPLETKNTLFFIDLFIQFSKNEINASHLWYYSCFCLCINFRPLKVKWNHWVYSLNSVFALLHPRPQDLCRLQRWKKKDLFWNFVCTCKKKKKSKTCCFIKVLHCKTFFFYW